VWGNALKSGDDQPNGKDSGSRRTVSRLPNKDPWPRLTREPYGDTRKEHACQHGIVERAGARRVVVASQNQAVEGPMWPGSSSLARLCLR
jgi:hypothetical protein